MTTETVRLDALVRRLRQHALPDPHDEREVLHAPLLTEAADALEREKRRADWFEQRCNTLQQAQANMRDPERKMVCDILANGKTYVTPNAN